MHVRNFIDTDIQYEIMEYFEIPDRFLEVEFKGWKHIEIHSIDGDFSLIVNMARVMFKKIVEHYSKEYVFTEPCFSFQPDIMIFKLKVGIRKKNDSMETPNDTHKKPEKSPKKSKTNK